MKTGKRKAFRKSFVLLLVMAVALIQVVPVAASPTGAVTGTFGTTQAPTVDSIVIHDVGTTDVPASLTPQQSYDVKVTVSDPDGIGELDTVTVLLWHDSLGTSDDVSDFETELLNMRDSRVLAEVSWDRDTNMAAIDAGEGTTWALVDSTLPLVADLDNSANTSFTFIFQVKVGKIAWETTGAEKWQVGVQATDQGGLKGYGRVETAGQPGLPMNWYGEVEVPEEHEVDWGSIPAGINFDHEDAKESVTSITYIANGNYGEQVKAANSWTEEGGGAPVSLTADAALANTFALSAKSGEDDHSTAAPVPVDESFATMADSGESTTYAGVTPDTYLYIKLNGEFNVGVYSGSITFGIFNSDR